ncbi:hypothetical protein [Gallibacterium anatis]|uniref:hypothetical protein n=1 Tax=Gallibacterium anatis TaxID=750 RepID=UPI000531A88F|nr:hypothetical protein [Gallibacterium anatis]KGQ27266.1 hypothetical protein JP31_04640 [Gallibacterium anatis]KGQ28895.1 hypothetical protein JP27_02580 [Gallibacterium anatis]WIM83059.1 hypothetical protein QP019_05265 [Gallibacterium anatis]
MKNFKQTAVSALIAASVVTPSFATEPVTGVKESVMSVRHLVKHDATAEEAFTALGHLTESIKNAFRFLDNAQYEISNDKLDILLLSRELIDVVSDYFVSNYEELIWGPYRKQYRAYSNAVAAFDTAIFHVRDKKGLVKVVAMPDLVFTEEDMVKLSQEARELTESYA